MSAPASPTPIRILIVDDHALIRAGLRMLIDSETGLKVVGEADCCSHAYILVMHEQPDIVLLDLDLNGPSGLTLIPMLVATTTARVIVLTGMRDQDLHCRAIQFGAHGVVQKAEAPRILLQAITDVHAGASWFGPALMARVANGVDPDSSNLSIDSDAAKIRSLTARERDVMELVCEGLTNHLIGMRLSISEATVRHHLTSIYGKLGVTSRLELALYCSRHGLARSETATAAHHDI